MKNIIVIYTLTIFICFIGFFASNCCAQAKRKLFENYYNKIGSYPEDGTNDWNPNGTETQGVTHDSLNWYFVTTDVDKENTHLWRIPAKYPLNKDVSSFEGVKSTTMQKQPTLKKNNYNHWGDPDHYQYNGIDYILVPITSTIEGNKPAIAVFIAQSLSLVGYGELTGDTLPDHKHPQVDIGWCAVAPTNGDLYTSNDNPDIYLTYFAFGPLYTSSLFQYKLDWDKISKYTVQGKFPATYITYKTCDTLFKDRKLGVFGGNSLYNMQGGEFTPGGELLYISCGGGQCFGGQGTFSSDGIHVLETNSWQEIKKSTNNERGEIGYFNYSFNNGCNSCGFFGGGYGAHTPEGLTIWDLDDGKAPHISGQLHVLINFYNNYSLCDDAISFQHFSGKFYVDGIQGKPPTWLNWINSLPGTKQNPFFTLQDALNWYPAWDGVEIALRNGTYGDIGHYSSRVKISSSGGAAIIGKPNPAIHGIVLYEHPDYKGDYRYFTTDVADLDLGTINFADVASSIRLYNIKEVIVYDKKNFGGASFVITKNDNQLPPNWNDLIGSFRIIR